MIALEVREVAELRHVEVRHDGRPCGVLVMSPRAALELERALDVWRGCLAVAHDMGTCDWCSLGEDQNPDHQHDDDCPLAGFEDTRASEAPWACAACRGLGHVIVIPRDCPLEVAQAKASHVVVRGDLPDDGLGFSQCHVCHGSGRIDVDCAEWEKILG